MDTGNIFSNIPEDHKDEWFEDILRTDGFKLERIVSRGHSTPEGTWLDQDRDEWVLLIKGRAGLRFEEEKEILPMNPGDHVLIPAGRRHRVEWTDEEENTVWLAIHF